MSKISVLLCDGDAARFTAYCQERGYKKSTLIARLVRDHLDGEGFTSAPRDRLQEALRTAERPAQRRGVGAQ